LALGRSFAANDTIGHLIEPGEQEELEEEVAGHVRALLDALVIDRQHDHNTQDTARRVAKMLIRESMAGRYTECPAITDFPNARGLDEIYTVGPITVRSMCSHHLVPIVGQAWLGIIPTERVIGLSKFTRLVGWVMARPQIQEEATVQIADLLEEALKPRGLALVVKAEHLCMTWRGVRDAGTAMVTSVMRGAFRDKEAARAEFLSLIGR